MKKKKVYLPAWKAYLYSLIRRWNIYKWMNKGMLEFNLTHSEAGLLLVAVKKYLTKEEQRQTLGIQYWLLANRILTEQQTIALPKEVKIAEKLLITNKINLGELIMEIKEIKKFAKEVGLSVSDIKGKDVDELIIEIIKNVDPDGEYSSDFVAWYEELEDDYFDEAEAIDEEEEEEEEDEEEDEEEVKPAVKRGRKAKEEVKEEPKKRGRKAKEEVIEEDEEEDEEEIDNDEIIAAINECSTTEELKDLVDENELEVFSDIKWRQGRGKSPYRDFDEVKTEMLSLLGVEVEEEEEEEEEEIEAAEVTPDLVKELVKAKDKAALAEICEQFGIELKALEKRMPQVMADKIMDVIEVKTEKKNAEGKKRGRPAKKEVEEDKTEPAEERVSVYQIVEDMVLAGKDEKEIVKAVTPIWEARGKKPLFVKKWVKAFVEIVEADNE